jgi:hypothetical protein
MIENNELLGQLRAQTAILSTISKQLDRLLASEERSPEGLPICARHGEVLRRREKQGDEWFSHRVLLPDGSTVFCKGRPGKDSPGWEIEPAAPRPPVVATRVLPETPKAATSPANGPTAFWTIAAQLEAADKLSHAQAGQIAQSDGSWTEKAARLLLS